MNNPTMDVRYVARLARLKLTDEESALYQSQLEEVLRYAQSLESADVEGIEPTAHPRPVANVFREDVPGDSQSAEDTLANAPRSANGLVIVPRILE